MASTNFTTHYSIPTPLGTDLTTPMDYNEAAEAVDTALFGAVTDAGNASIAAGNAVNTANAASDAVDTVAADLAQEKAKIVALQTRVTNAENEIDDVRADSSDMITAYNEPTATSTHAYAIGDFFIYNNTLYKATAAIAIGDTIVPDTNCETTNVSTELVEIKSALTDKLDKAETVLATVIADGSKTYSQLLTSLGLPTNRRSKLRIVSADQRTVDYFEYMQGTGTKASFIGFSNDSTNNFYRVDVVSSTNSSIFQKIALGTSGNTFTDMSATAVTSGTKFQYII